MKTFIKNLMMFLVLGAMMSACSGATEGVVIIDEEPEVDVRNPNTETSENEGEDESSGSGGDRRSRTTQTERVLLSGYTELENLDLAAAEEDYCDEYEAGSADSEIAFGCFLTRALLLPETTDGQNLLTTLGQSTIDVEQDILQDIIGTLAHFDQFVYSDYSQLPFQTSVSFLNQDNYRSAFDAFGADIYAANSEASDIQADALSLVDDLEEMAEMLDVVLADTSFHFVIPGEVFYHQVDPDVMYNDIHFMMAAVKTKIVAINVLNAYDWGVTVQDSHDGSEWNQEILAEDLNGTGATVRGVTVDGTPFLTMQDSSLITDSYDIIKDAIDHLVEGLANANVTYNLEDFASYLSMDYQLMENNALALQTSISESGLEYISFENSSNGYVDLYEFFTNPPSAADVTTMDPFVYNSNEDRVELVEAYFQEMFDGIWAE